MDDVSCAFVFNAKRVENVTNRKNLFLFILNIDVLDVLLDTFLVYVQKYEFRKKESITRCSDYLPFNSNKANQK